MSMSSLPGWADHSMPAAGAPTGQAMRMTGHGLRPSGQDRTMHRRSSTVLHGGGSFIMPGPFHGSARLKMSDPGAGVPRSESQPDLRRAVGVGAVAPRWICCPGTGGYHVPAKHDDHEHGLREARHEFSETQKWQQRRELQAEQRSIDILEHAPQSGHLTRKEAALKTYDINGRVYCAQKDNAPPPVQAKRWHWTCQVNGTTNEYNIVNNLPQHSHLTKCRTQEIERLQESAGGRVIAGDIQPQKPVNSYQIPGFVPIKPRSYLGTTERHYTLFS